MHGSHRYSRTTMVVPVPRDWNVIAHHKVTQAIQSGRLVRQPCEVCGELEVEGHHDDYSRPLEVRWLCPSHHHLRHSEIGYHLYTIPTTGTLENILIELDRRREAEGVTRETFCEQMHLTTSLFVQLRRGAKGIGAEALALILARYPGMDNHVLAYLRERGQVARQKAKG